MVSRILTHFMPPQMIADAEGLIECVREHHGEPRMFYGPVETTGNHGETVVAIGAVWFIKTVNHGFKFVWSRRAYGTVMFHANDAKAVIHRIEFNVNSAHIPVGFMLECARTVGLLPETAEQPPSDRWSAILDTRSSDAVRSVDTIQSDVV